jgi:hypothetical protein
MRHDFYSGIKPGLKGEGALVQASNRSGWVLVQFDNLRLGRGLTHGWHLFPASAFPRTAQPGFEIPSTTSARDCCEPCLPPVRREKVFIVDHGFKLREYRGGYSERPAW